MVTIEMMAAIASVYFAAVCNNAFWAAAQAAGGFSGPNGWVVAACLFLALSALQFVLLCILLNRWTAKILLTLLLLISPVANGLLGSSGGYIDSEVLSTLLHTESEHFWTLVTGDLLTAVVVQGMIPSILVWGARLKRVSLSHAISVRCVAVFSAMVLAVTALQLTRHEFTVLTREHPSLKYRIIPGNMVVAVMILLVNQPRATPEDQRPSVPDDVVMVHTRARLGKAIDDSSGAADRHCL